MLVKNLNYTGTKSCKCASWLEHWEKASGTKAGKCVSEKCNQKATRGGHIIRVGSEDRNHYIIPICASCNALESVYMIPDNSFLGSANVSKTCA